MEQEGAGGTVTAEPPGKAYQHTAIAALRIEIAHFDAGRPPRLRGRFDVRELRLSRGCAVSIEKSTDLWAGGRRSNRFMTSFPFHLQLGGVLPVRIGGSPRAGAPPLGRHDDPSAGRLRTISAGQRGAAAADDRPTEVVLDQRSDESLLEAYMGGDRAAFRTLMGRYDNELIHFLTRFLGSRAAADDVFQETFLQIHLSADTFDPQRRFKPWLFTIAANKARDYHRKHHRSNTASLSAAIDASGDGERFVDLLEADVPNPDMPLLDAERSRLVKKAVDSLPAHLREILLLSYFQGFSYNQIADALEIPLGTVKSRLHTAVAAFARAWNAAMRRERDLEEGGTDETGSSEERSDGRNA